jgi:two-component system cell cycle response regulator
MAHLLMMGIGAALCIARGVIRPRERAAWIVLGLGVLAWTLGELYFTAVLWSDASPPVPSPADAGYLSLPPLIILGVALLTRSHVRGLPRMVFVDGVIAGLAIGAMSAAIVFKPVLSSLHGLSISVITNFAYPVLDLIMLGVLCGVLAIGGRRLDRRLGVLALGVLCFWASDTVYLIKDAAGTWVSGGPYDPGWWAIAECAAVAAWMNPTAARSPHPFRSARTSIRIPVAFALVALAVLVAGSFTTVTVPAVILASTALVSVLVRLVLTFRAHQGMLDSSRTEASTDPLTGLGNRRALARALAARLDEPEPEPLLLGLFDLNGFKNYNDSFGRAAGDALLQRFAWSLERVLPPPAAAYRMGGDEFCVLLPVGDEGQALLRAAHAVLAEQGDGFEISASAGTVTLPEETADCSDALQLADQRMYCDKHSFRRTGTAQEVARTLLSALAQRDPDLTVCDSYDAMTSDRCYRRAMSEEVAVAELRAGAGSQFDPEVVAAFLRVRERDLRPESGAPATSPARAN